MKKSEKNESNQIGKVYSKPWGNYQTLHMKGNYQIKVITIKPGGKLSLQKHEHRCEHWVIVKGALKVTKGDKKSNKQVNDYIFIDKEEVHRLENEQEVNAELVEIQYGDYLGEDDIIRLDDKYGRTSKKSIK